MPKRKSKKSVEKNNKWIVLLIVIIVLSLVVDLLSLSVLNSIAKSRSGLEGELAFTKWVRPQEYYTCIGRANFQKSAAKSRYDAAKSEWESSRDSYYPSYYDSGYDDALARWQQAQADWEMAQGQYEEAMARCDDMYPAYEVYDDPGVSDYPYYSGYGS